MTRPSKYLALLFLSLFLLPTGAHAFSESDLQRLLETGSCPDCDLRGADLTDANLKDANLTGTDFTNANLNGATMDTTIQVGTDSRRSPQNPFGPGSF